MRLEELPPECFGGICSFLQLKHCLDLASASLVLMRETLPELYRRRLRMKESSTTDEVRHPALQLIVVPTVKERVIELCQQLPTSYHLYKEAVELRDDLMKKEFDDASFRCIELDFPVLFGRLTQILQAHKLHSRLLKSVIGSTPWVETNVITLEHYIGDVLVIAFLINQSTLRLVEGGPTTVTYVRRLREEPQKSLAFRYKNWVLIHSSILRMKRFTFQELKRLRIPDLSPVSALLPNDCYINDFFLSCKVTVTMDDFGPLGPTFRGRDQVRSRDLSARCLFAFFVSHDIQTIGETQRNAMDWLCLVHEEARKTRPMSVRSPRVRFENEENVQ